MNKTSLEQQLRRHAVNFAVDCDVIDRAGDGWPVRISSPDDGFFIGLLLISRFAPVAENCAPHSKWATL
jgi:hypothetical protein